MAKSKSNGKPEAWRSRIVGHGSKPASEFLANPLNWRIHSKDQQAALGGVLSEIGWVQDVVENVQTGHLIDGHLRVILAMRRDEQEPVPYVQVDLSEAEEALVLATLDPLAAMATADAQKLDELLRDVATGDAAVQAMLAELAKASGLDYGKPVAEDPGAQIDRAEELREKWRTATGQSWELVSIVNPGVLHRLLCGDSTVAGDVARLVGDLQVGAVVFDPPYDAEATVLDVRYPSGDALVFTDHRHLFDCTEGWGRFRCLFAWDGVTSWYTPGWPLARCKLALWFGECEYNPDGAHYGSPDKPHIASNTRGTYHYRPDPRGKHLATVFQSALTKEYDGHPHAKPVDWLRCLIGDCTQGAVLDLFAGSGAALVACEQLGRPWRGMEIDPATMAVVLERAAVMGLESRLVDA